MSAGKWRSEGRLNHLLQLGTGSWRSGRPGKREEGGDGEGDLGEGGRAGAGAGPGVEMGGDRAAVLVQVSVSVCAWLFVALTGAIVEHPVRQAAAEASLAAITAQRAQHLVHWATLGHWQTEPRAAGTANLRLRLRECAACRATPPLPMSPIDPPSLQPSARSSAQQQREAELSHMHALIWLLT